MIYLVGNNYTENINGATKITEPSSQTSEVSREKKIPAHNIINIAVNGGPGSGKGSFEGVIVNELTTLNELPATVILVAESARDVIDELKSKGTLHEVLNKGELSTLILSEQERRRVIAEELQNSLPDNNIFVIYDRDQSNNAIYETFYKHFNFQTETLDQAAFTNELNASRSFKDMGKEMRDLYDISYCLKPVNHEVHYACSNPKIGGAKKDETRTESFKMAKELHNALEIGAKIIFSKKLVIVDNTDSLDPNVKAADTIKSRAVEHVEELQILMNTRIKENQAHADFYNRLIASA